jgi:hypothetical protein
MSHDQLCFPIPTKVDAERVAGAFYIVLNDASKNIVDFYKGAVHKLLNSKKGGRRFALAISQGRKMEYKGNTQGREGVKIFRKALRNLWLALKANMIPT